MAKRTSGSKLRDSVSKVVNLNNGARLETYVIKGERGSGIFALNGPAARTAQPGDQVFILAYGLIEHTQAAIKPVLVDLSLILMVLVEFP